MQRLNAVFFGRASLPVSGRIPFLRQPLTLHEFYNSSHNLKRQGNSCFFIKSDLFGKSDRFYKKIFVKRFFAADLSGYCGSAQKTILCLACDSHEYFDGCYTVV